MIRYVVTCKACGAATGTNPPGMGVTLDEQRAAYTDCCQCGRKVLRDGGEYLKPKQEPKPEFDLLSME